MSTALHSGLFFEWNDTLLLSNFDKQLTPRNIAMSAVRLLLLNYPTPESRHFKLILENTIRG